MRVSLALSGGAARGLFHLGVIAALERNGVEIGAISGTSIGSVVAVGIGSGVSPYDLLRLFQSKAFRSIFEFNYFRRGLLRINEKAAILRDIAPIERLEKMTIPTYVTCVDLHSNDIVRFCEGDTVALTLASAALIPLFRPISYEQYLLIDGGFMDNLPVEPLVQYHEPIISVNLFPEQKAHISKLSLIERAIGLSMLASSQSQIKQSDLCISDSELNGFGLFTFGQMMACFELGYRKGSESILTFLSQKSIMKCF